jgi:hypothetical protein
VVVEVAAAACEGNYGNRAARGVNGSGGKEVCGLVETAPHQDTKAFILRRGGLQGALHLGHEHGEVAAQQQREEFRLLAVGPRRARVQDPLDDGAGEDRVHRQGLVDIGFVLDGDDHDWPSLSPAGALSA